MVFGHIGIWDVHVFAKLRRSEIAGCTWRLSGAASLALATSSQVQQVYRELGLAAARGCARDLLRTLPHALGRAVERAGSSAHQASVRARHADTPKRSRRLQYTSCISLRPSML